ncbi:hypothetical protein FACS189465_0660 [Clostridia bacterium]|nr:hypothetical protein FACS189465_0660 [Clostridia bacterium]
MLKIDLLRYALITGTSERILRFMGGPVKADGQPHHAAKPELITRINQWYDGLRVRHWLGRNSLKFYNEQNVLRFEMTMNDPTKYRIHRHIEGQKESPKKLLPMRKGIADIAVGTKICHDRVNSFTEHMGTFTDTTPIKDIFMPFSKPVISNNKRFRALDIFGKDQELLLAIADPKYNVEAITNKQLQLQFKCADSAKGLSQKQLSSRIGRQLRLLREHGIIKKLPNQRKYALTENARTLTTEMSVLLSASTQELLKMVA